MILGIGTDILDIERIRTALESGMDSFFQATYTDAERRQAGRRPDPAAYFATRFAGKEAVFKCLGIDSDRVRLNEIEILATATGQPQVTVTGHVKEIVMQKGIGNIQVSLSFETTYAVAFAVAQSQEGG
jgi:phosphopantetheine--protein transferase-like protein